MEKSRNSKFIPSSTMTDLSHSLAHHLFNFPRSLVGLQSSPSHVPGFSGALSNSPSDKYSISFSSSESWAVGRLLIPHALSHLPSQTKIHGLPYIIICFNIIFPLPLPSPQSVPRIQCPHLPDWTAFLFGIGLVCRQY